MHNHDRLLETLDDYALWAGTKFPGLGSILRYAAEAIRELVEDNRKMRALIEDDF